MPSAEPLSAATNTAPQRFIRRNVSCTSSSSIAPPSGVRSASFRTAPTARLARAVCTTAEAPLDVASPSDADDCRAGLFMPAAGRPPLVILGHGLGATREYGLEPFGQRFADAGIAALVFTYRHSGDSGGEPRQLLDIERQLGDWAAALAYARTLEGIDGQRIALWGTSFGGGHVIEAAARDGAVAAVVSQCPFTDGLAATRAASPRSLVRALAPALRDELARIRHKPPVLVPLVGSHGSAALM